MKNKIYLLIIFVLLVQGFQFAVEHSANGVKEFVKYINQNQKDLGINSYGLLEQDGRIDVKIYLPKEQLSGLKKIVEKYNYTNIKYGSGNEFDNHDLVITVTFNKVKKESEDKFTEKKVVDNSDDNNKPNIKNDISLERKVNKKPNLIVSKEKKIKKKKCPRRVKVQVEKVLIKDFNLYKNFKLPIKPSNKIDVISQTKGVVSKLSVENSNYIEAGTVIVNFDIKKINEELSVLKNKLKDWKTKLFKREHWKVRSSRAEDNAKRIIKETQSLIELKQEELNLMKVQAQINGKIFYKISVGDSVEKDGIIATIINDKKMKIIIPESDEKLFNNNDKINIKFENISELYSGTVTIDGTRKFIEIDNKNENLKEGMFASFKVVKEIVKDAIVVDSSLLYKENSRIYTFVVEGKRAKKVYVKVKSEDKIRKESLVESGLLREDEVIITNQNCLKDKKKIKVMVVDPVTGKLVKRKKKKFKQRIKRETVKEKILKQTSVSINRVSGNFLKLSLGGGYHYIADSIFSEIYGNGLISGRFELSYTINNKFEIFLASNYISKKGNFTGLKEDVSLNMIPVYFGGKYNFNTDKKFSPFVGLAFTAYAVKEKTNDEQTAFLTDYGASLIVGVNMALNRNIDLFCHLKYDYIQLTVEALDNEKLDVSGTSLVVGASYRFKF